MLENKVYVLDDLISKEYQNYLINLFYSVPFNLNPNDSVGYYSNQKSDWGEFISLNNIKEDVYDLPQMTSTFVYEGQVINDMFFYFNKLVPLYDAVQSYFNYTFDYNIIRCKANLKHQVHESYLDKFNPPHIDAKFEHWVLIYYINNSDGDTIIFKEQYNSNVITSNFTIDQKISPKQGRLIFFPGHKFHSANFPTKSSTRLILNNVLEISSV